MEKYSSKETVQAAVVTHVTIKASQACDNYKVLVHTECGEKIEVMRVRVPDFLYCYDQKAYIVKNGLGNYDFLPSDAFHDQYQESPERIAEKSTDSDLIDQIRKAIKEQEFSPAPVIFSSKFADEKPQRIKAEDAMCILVNGGVVSDDFGLVIYHIDGHFRYRNGDQESGDSGIYVFLDFDQMYNVLSVGGGND